VVQSLAPTFDPGLVKLQKAQDPNKIKYPVNSSNDLS